MNSVKRTCQRRVLALFAVALSLMVLFAPAISNDGSDGATATYTYTISPSGAISGNYTPIANNSASSGSYTSTSTSNVGSWGFDSEGYGPFGSFYAAFDPTQNNKMICHLNPYDLTKSVDNESVPVDSYNIMWCLPTVYWKTDSSGNLILTNDSNAGGTAYAHTIDGEVYNYIAIGVYEASKKTIGSTDVLVSTSGTTPLVSSTRATFRDYANNQSVSTVDGSSSNVNGHAMVWNFYQWELYKYCALAVMGGWDSQSIAGNGSSYGGSPYYDTPGLLNAAGPYAGTKGSVSNTSYIQDPVKVFIENAWGSVYDFVDGVVINGRTIVVDTKSVPTDATSGANITAYSNVLPSSSGYGSSPSTTAGVWGMPTANSGSSTSGLYDYVYVSSSDSRVLCVGGFSYTSTSTAPIYGLSYAGANNSLSYSSTFIGGRLAFVFDADSAATPTVTLDHSDLTGNNGDATGLPAKVDITDGAVYPDLNDCSSNPSIVAGWTHAGWLVNGVEYEPGATITITDPHTAKSVWVEPKNIMFDHGALVGLLNGTSLGTDGLPDTKKIVDANTTYPDLNDECPTNSAIAAGYTHVGWYVNEVFYNIGATVVSQTTHTAYSVWIVPQITITFYVEGQEYSTLTVPKGSCGVVFTPKMVEGVFEGWYYTSDFASDQKYDSSKVLNQDVSVYAKGVPPLEFTSIPTASATITSVNPYGLVYFDATQSTGKYQIHWDFGDGNTSDESIAYNTYTQPGKYNVTLTVTNLYGDVATETYTVTVGEDEATDDGGDRTLLMIVSGVVVIVLAGVFVRRFV